MENLYFFTGEETFLLHQQLKAWKEAFIKKYEGDFNVNTINGREMDVAEIINQLEAAPFLGEKRLIIVEHLPEAPSTKKNDKVSKKDESREEAMKRLADFLETIPLSNVVIFVQPKPDKRKSLYKKCVQLCTVKTFESLSGSQLSDWVQERVKRYKTSIDIRSAEHLTSLTGHDLWRIDQELMKLASYNQEKPIDRSSIDTLVVPTIEANIFHLTDALGIKDHRKAIHNLHKTMAAGENLRQTFYMIVRQFRLFLQVSGYLANYPNTSANNIASSLKLHPFVARNTVSQLKHFKIPELKTAYQRLLAIDIALKTSQIRITTDDQDELAMAIEKFILKFCHSTKGSFV